MGWLEGGGGACQKLVNDCLVTNFERILPTCFKLMERLIEVKLVRDGGKSLLEGRVIERDSHVSETLEGRPLRVRKLLTTWSRKKGEKTKNNSLTTRTHTDSLRGLCIGPPTTRFGP